MIPGLPRWRGTRPGAGPSEFRVMIRPVHRLSYLPQPASASASESRCPAGFKLPNWLEPTVTVTAAGPVTVTRSWRRGRRRAWACSEAAGSARPAAAPRALGPGP